MSLVSLTALKMELARLRTENSAKISRENWFSSGAGLKISPAPHPRRTFTCTPHSQEHRPTAFVRFFVRFLNFKKTGPSAFVHLLDLRKWKPTGFTLVFLRLRKHRPTYLRAGVFLKQRHSCTCRAPGIQGYHGTLRQAVGRFSLT